MENTNEKKIIKTDLLGLYYIYKQQKIILFNLDNNSYSDGYIYAVSKDIYPLYEETDESEYFKTCYKIKKTFIERVLSELGKVDDEFCTNFRIDKKEAYNKLPDYWSFLDKLEIKRHSVADSQVYQVLRYLYLENNNFKTVLSHFVEDEQCPIEYKGLMREFDKSEVFNY